ncbi:HEAT repeat domain-containing protein [Gordoniibacillus kamchatkensis]|uniref:HEAT repeat domain-containing protein n=1 Tax=Gordoniibacillus kamchatkensis TaxID=1590651 RepID=UPI001E59FB1A|nr:HEAT repeat domain-containing protein [Paenibacillus sp. VKM B-2647]
MFDDPVITGALTSVLGPNYMLHAHRHGHYNAVPVPGGWHKDSYWGYKRMRNHHPWWAMIMYFPQNTPKELGPTGVMPGTPYYETRTFAADETPDEALASGEAGTFALIHYDIWHRSTPNLLGQPRYMLKFEFMRTAAPAEPSWSNEVREWQPPAGLSSSIYRQEALWEENWNWLCGSMGSLAGTAPDEEESVRELARELENPFEPAALHAAYELARRGRKGTDALLQGIRHESVAVSRVSAYGLSAAGKEAVQGLIDALSDERAETAVHAAFALGEQRQLAAEATPRLAALLDHPSEEVRRSAVEALGLIAAPVDLAVAGLIRALGDADVQVRFTAGLSLCRIGAPAQAAVPHLEAALDDENRYVRAHAAEALRYIGTDQAKDVLIKSLFNTRWCSSTTPASTFYP